ncbi:MAG: stage IV sporulation protein A [Clostridia bacterium]
MENSKIYDEISVRTGGDIYIGVVGPVRTGKSTFIKRFMENMVIPNIDNVYKRERAKDELPQSGSGRTIMTAEPKFVPEEAAEILIDGGMCQVRLVDCVGYMVEGALGDMEEDSPRMVTTPWSENEMTMKEASEIGTRKVITEHSTIGLVITTDGTVTDIDAENYIEAEDKVITELQDIGKPFVTLINTNNPSSEEARLVKKRIYDKYGIVAMCINCMTLTEIEINEIIKSVLYEFPISEIRIETPSWLNSLPHESEIKTYIYSNILQSANLCTCMKDIKFLCSNINLINNINSCNVLNQDLATGISNLSITIPQEIFYDIIKEETGFKITSEADLIPMLTQFAQMEKEFSRINGALEQVRQTGYGIVMPSIDELTLNRPEIVKQSGKFGVKLKANAPSIHNDNTKHKFLFSA